MCVSSSTTKQLTILIPSTQRLHQVPQDCPAPTSDANVKSRLSPVLVTDRYKLEIPTTPNHV